MVTAEQMLQAGYNCGLSDIKEAYSQIIRHYDVFFCIEKINEEMEAFHQTLHSKGLMRCYMGRYAVNEMTIEEGASLIGYTLLELPEEPPEDSLTDILNDGVEMLECISLEDLLTEEGSEDERSDKDLTEN